MVNYWAVLVAAISAIVIGSIWWGLLFGKYWMEQNGLDKLSPEQQETMKKAMPMLYVQQAILSVIQAWVIAYVLSQYDIGGMGDAMKYIAIIWLGFLFPTTYGPKLWANKPYKFVILTSLNTLITVLIMAVIIAAWK